MAPEWNVRVDVLGEPVVVSEYVAAYYLEANELRIGVWSVDDGTSVWSDAADISLQAGGYYVSPAIAGSDDGRWWIAYLRPGEQGWNKGWVRLTVADVSTGKARMLNRPGEPKDAWVPLRAHVLPDDCAEATVFCVAGRLEHAESAGHYRVDPASGRLDDERDIPSPSGARMLGEHVFATNERGPDGTEMIGYAANGAVAWQRPYAEVFGDGASSDAGWKVAEVDGTIVAAGGRTDVGSRTDDQHWKRDLTETVLVGVDATDGTMRWSVPSVITCEVAQDSWTATAEVIPICRVNHGEVTRDGETFTFDIDLDLIGVDVRNGAVVWEVPLGEASANLAATGSDTVFAAAGEWRQAVGDDGEVVSVNVITGEVRPVKSGETFICIRRSEAWVHPRSDDSEEMIEYANTGSEAFPCDVDRGQLEGQGLPVSALRDFASVGDNGWHVVRVVGGLSGYRLEAPSTSDDA